MVVDTLCCWWYVCRDCDYGCVAVCDVLCGVVHCVLVGVCGCECMITVWCCIWYDGTAWLMCVVWV